MKEYVLDILIALFLVAVVCGLAITMFLVLPYLFLQLW